MDVLLIPIIVLGSIGIIGTIVFLAKAFGIKDRLLPIEKAKTPRITVHPTCVKISSIQYMGSFSRVSLYDGFIIIRVLGQTRVIVPDKLARSIEYNNNNMTIYVNENEFITKIIIYSGFDSILSIEMMKWERGKIKERSS
jgi:hypothetical protein